MVQDKLERLINLVYKRWKSGHQNPGEWHPDEEALVCFLEGRLSSEESGQIKMHLISCERCIEAAAIQLKLTPPLHAGAGLKATEEKEVPQELIERVKELLAQKDDFSVLEILLRLKEKAVEILNTTGDVLVGQELVPAPVLRSRQIKDFKDEVVIFKDFKDIRVEVKLENKGTGVFDLTVAAKEKKTQKIIKDLRVTLLKDDVELESYIVDSGSVIFEHALLGKYKVEISTFENKLASILLDIKV